MLSMTIAQKAKASLKRLHAISLLAAERARSGVVYAPFGKAFWADPYPMYAALRERDPVHHSLLTKSWVLTRYQDVDSVLRDSRFLVGAGKQEQFAQAKADQARAGVVDADQQITPSMLMLDPPDHTRMRGLVSKAFTPVRIEALRPRIEALVHELLDGVADQGGMDVIADFAYPLPATVIAEMLGIPPEDRHHFKRWSDDLVRGIGSGSMTELSRTYDALVDMQGYLGRIAQQQPANPEGGLLGALLAAEEQGDKLSLSEVYGNAGFLLTAGHVTTTSLIGNGVFALLRHPDQLDLLRREPALIESAVEEMLRYDGPTQATARFPTQEVEVAGRTIAPGEQVSLLLAAANRDPERFTDPDRLDIARKGNYHLAFAQGIHHCLGARLARLEVQVAVLALVQRFPNLRLGEDKPVWEQHSFLRSLSALPVTF